MCNTRPTLKKYKMNFTKILTINRNTIEMSDINCVQQQLRFFGANESEISNSKMMIFGSPNESGRTDGGNVMISRDIFYASSKWYILCATKDL